MGIKRRKSGEVASITAEHRYLAIVAVVPFLLFLALFKPGLGLSRDWDIFASATPFLILAFLPALDRVRSETRTWIVPVMFLGVLQTGTWIAVNANAERIEARFKETLVSDPPHGGYDYEILAEYYLRQQRHEDALEALRSAYDVERNPRYAFNAGVKAAELGRLDEAIDFMYRCIRTAPTYSTARVKLASYLVTKRDFNSVIDVTRQGLEFEPDNIYFNVLLGMALFETQQYDAAYPQLRRSLDLDLPSEMRSDVARAAALIEQAMRASEQNQH